MSIINQSPQLQATDPRLHADLLEALAKFRRSQHQDAEAKTLLLKALETRPSERGHDRWLRLNTKYDLGRVCGELGHFDEAECYLKEAMEGRIGKKGLDDTNTLRAMRELEGLYTRMAKINKAEPLVFEALEGLRHNLRDQQTNAQRAWDSLIDYYEAAGKPDEAGYWQTQLAQAEKRTDKVDGP